jgi:hypothetical protein
MLSARPAANTATALVRPVDENYAQALREDGLLAGTLVATDEGWRPVEGIVAGDMVLTFDNGMQPVRAVHKIEIARANVPTHKAFTMFIPAGALGNRKDMLLMPSQEVIVESDRAEIDFGEPFVLIQTLLLDGYRGIRKTQIQRDLSVYMLTFDNEQILHTSGATLIACRAEVDFSPLDAAGRMQGVQTYNRLTPAQVRRVATWLRDEDGLDGFDTQTVDDLYAALEARLS